TSVATVVCIRVLMLSMRDCGKRLSALLCTFGRQGRFGDDRLRYSGRAPLCRMGWSQISTKRRQSAMARPLLTVEIRLFWRMHVRKTLSIVMTLGLLGATALAWAPRQQAKPASTRSTAPSNEEVLTAVRADLQGASADIMAKNLTL